MTQALSSDRFEVLREARTGLDPSRRMLWDTVVSAAAEGSRGAREWTPAEVMGAMSGLPAAKAGARETMEMFSPGAGRGIRTPTASTSLQGCWSWTATAPCDQKDCRDSLEGDDETCGLLLNCSESVRTISVAELAEMASDCPASFVPVSARGPKIRGEKRTERELIRAAWNYLLLNLDIVSWAICRVTGVMQDTRSIALMRRLVGKSVYRVTIRLFPTSGAYFGLYGTGMIGIPRLNPSFENMLAMWERGDHQTRQCAAMDLAVILLHEVMHLSGYTYIDLFGGCYVNYVAHNLFRWGLFHRYPKATLPTCCDQADADSLVGCGALIGLNGKCDLDGQASGVFGGASEWIRETLGWLVTQGPSLLWDVAWFIGGALAGALIRGLHEWLDNAGDWLRGLFEGAGVRSSGGPGYSSCGDTLCYEYCPELWEDSPHGCVLRNPDNVSALNRCMEECLFGSEPGSAEGSGSGGDDYGIPGWEGL